MVKLLTSFLIIISLSLLFINPVMAQRGDKYGLDTATGAANAGGPVLETGADPASASNSIAIGLGKIVGAVLAFLGVIFLVLMIYGGVTWMTAAGNEAQVAKARTLIVAAIIGLLIVLSAYAITSYLADNINFGK